MDSVYSKPLFDHTITQTLRFNGDMRFVGEVAGDVLIGI